LRNNVPLPCVAHALCTRQDARAYRGFIAKVFTVLAEFSGKNATEMIYMDKLTQE
jgi:6-phosphogluconate dehydrogenase (decarboxylating)